MGIPKFILGIVILIVLIYIAKMLYDIRKQGIIIVSVNTNQKPSDTKSKIDKVVQQAEGFSQSAADVLGGIFGGRGMRQGFM